MNFQKVFSAIGAVAIGLSLTAGAALAAETEHEMDLSLKVECSKLSDIEVYAGDGGGVFAPIDIAYNEFSTQTQDGDIVVKVDVGCDFGEWSVNAEISRFQDGSIFKSFPGEKFSLESPVVTTSYYDGWGILEPMAPHADGADFEPIRGFPLDDAGSTAPIFHTTRHLLWFLGFDDYPAPFVSEAAFTGHLNDLEGILPGDYSATLTVILVTE